MSKQRAILKAASALPPRQARRVVAAIAAKTQDDKTQDAKEDASEDPYLEAAADAMQAALEAAVLEELEKLP